MVRSSALVAVFLLGQAFAPSEAPAQGWGEHLAILPSGLVPNAAVAAANMAAGGIAGGARAWLRGGDVADGFVRGAVGGAVVYAGKRIAGEPFTGSELLGRQLAAVGTGMVVNAGLGAPALRGLWLPVGPFYVRVNDPAGLGLRLNAADLGATIWAATRPELELDVAASLQTGALVFDAPRHRVRLRGDGVQGFAAGGIVVLGAGADEGVRRHEMIHVLQQDFENLVLSHPLEQWGWRAVLDREVPAVAGIVPMLLVYTPVLRLNEVEARIVSGR